MKTPAAPAVAEKITKRLGNINKGLSKTHKNPKMDPLYLI
jgi:hypothetical protein